ncbi:MAG: hypothetical protein N2483_04910, partial [Burkholderiaceae bacterium]|nr:hypothetical protein [Burkholderiaceae bacterium]
VATGRAARAEIRIGSTALRLDGETNVDFDRIDDAVIRIVLQRGTLTLRLRNREKLREIEVLTAREQIVFDDVGRYRIDVDRVPGITSLSTFVGVGRVVVNHMTFVVHSGQRGEISSLPSVRFQLVAAASDLFDEWVAQRDQRDDALRSTRYTSPETTGIESLDEYGEWRTVETYGTVWFPASVPVGWAPYRYGRWAYIPPWGWTWIDDAPWGFAPFHYGRWVYIRSAWAWVPGPYIARPCYAPALVAWYGSPGVSMSIGVSTVGWFPLAPGEIYIPPYRHSQRYVSYVNFGYGSHVTVIAPPSQYRYRQRDFSTWVPSDAVLRRLPIPRVIQAAPNEWVKLPTAPQPPIRVPVEGRKFKLQKLAPVFADVDANALRLDRPPQVIPPHGGDQPPARRDSPARTPINDGETQPPRRHLEPLPLDPPRVQLPRTAAPRPDGWPVQMPASRPRKPLPDDRPHRVQTEKMPSLPRPFDPAPQPAPRAEPPAFRADPASRREPKNDGPHPIKSMPRQRALAQ